MVRHYWMAVVIASALIGPLPAEEPTAKESTPDKGETDNIFGLTRLHQFHLRISADDFTAMEPPMGGPPFGPGGPVRGGPGQTGPGPGGMPGFDFKYVHADFLAGDETLKNVGIRYKGNATYATSSRSAKRPLKIDLDRFDDKQKFHGTRKLNLNNGVLDPTKIHEALAYAIFRAAGVPASQTAFAEVRLTVPGKYDAEHLGVYTLIEQVDKAFLKRHFKNAKGLLLKPEGISGITYLGDDPDVYAKPYNAKNSEGTPEQWQRLIEFARLINRADDDQFRQEIGTYLEIDEFVSFLAVNVMLSSFDGILTGMGHNYYLYLSPDTNRFVLIPWDLDITLGGFPMMFTPEQQVDLSIERPHMGQNKLIDRLLAMPDIKAAYRARLRELSEDLFRGDSLQKDIAAVEAVMKNPVARDKQAAGDRQDGARFGFGPPGMAGPPMPVTTFVEKRATSVLAQLDGKSQGFVPNMPGGPGMGGPGQHFARPALHFTDHNQDGKVSPQELQAAAGMLFKRWDKNGDGALDEQEIETGINSLLPGPQP